MGKLTRETDTDLFDGAAERAVEVAILEETYQDIKALCEQEGWEEDEGLRIVMARGLAYLQANAEIERLNRGDTDLAAELQKKIQQVADYYGMYSVMKFKAFKLLQVSRTLELNTAGIRGELNLARNTIPKLRQEIDRLRTENADLRRRLTEADLTPEAEIDTDGQDEPLATAGSAAEPASDTSSPETPLWRRLQQWWAEA